MKSWGLRLGRGPCEILLCLSCEPCIVQCLAYLLFTFPAIKYPIFLANGTDAWLYYCVSCHEQDTHTHTNPKFTVMTLLWTLERLASCLVHNIAASDGQVHKAAFVPGARQELSCTLCRNNAGMYIQSTFSIARAGGHQFMPGCECPVDESGVRGQAFAPQVLTLPKLDIALTYILIGSSSNLLLLLFDELHSTLSKLVGLPL